MPPQNDKVAVMPPGHQDKRQSFDAELHHLYFDDNESFFPPAWLGKDSVTRRSSNDSTTSKASGTETSRAESALNLSE
ncbi:hypothetical protein N7468_003256 [Penicillium chermesinum]|uniref:Uncharacterized protein n=1 Tax=Penicillium chermesinum TaxID=63820 RepID=A0A9W9P6C3_9EURO|nr:uncharacterized protein N7468_003256 [Penicillium chermesinum]KAJ5238637.1 hypothetical protein N7468_003256 [Penicillium chermesinum]KAJ6164284.1 hypothetical protein N7470_002956 [Penicillium chermesinum]